MIVIAVVVATVLICTIRPEPGGRTILEPAPPEPTSGDPGSALPFPPALPVDNAVESSTSATPSPAQPPTAQPPPAQPSPTHWTELIVPATTVVYDQNWSGLWTSGTAEHNGAVLVLETDGNVCVVYRGQVIWAANTAH
jgi:hypothetical protein